jgi:hypothetical protein
MASVALPKNTPSPIQCILEGTTTNIKQDIKSFLGKWVQLATGTIDGTSTGQLGSWNFPESLLAFDIYANKLEGFQGLRGTIMIKVLINGTQYQQGRLILSFIPQAQVSGSTAAIRLAHFTTITQLPHAEIDIACDSECIFEIPYISPSLFYNMLTGEGPWGTLYLHQYVPLATGAGSTDCTYAVWACFDPRTVELYNPTKGTILTSKPPGKSLRFQGQMRTVSRRRARAAPGVVEQSAGSHGTISNALMATSRVAGELSLIPSLKLIAGPVSWAAGLTGKLASAFGFSKPPDGDKIQRHERSYMHGSANCDGFDRSQILAVTSTCSVETSLDLSLTEEDEMSFDFMVTRKSYFTRFDWADSVAPGTLLKTFVMNPRQFINSTGSGASTTQFRTPLAHLASQFILWRGNIVLTFKLVKTDTHVGRLLVVFYPGLTAAPVSADDSDFCHRAIIDLDAGNEFTFTIPYCDEGPYLFSTGSYGCVCVYAFTGLRHSDLVAPSITILTEVSGAPGFEFALPTFDGYLPAYYTLSSPLTKSNASPLALKKDKEPMHGQSHPLAEEEEPIIRRPIEIQALGTIQDLDSDEEEKGFVGQMLTSSKVPTTTDANVCATETTTLGGAQAGSASLCAARLCIGERLTSVRQLVLRFTGATFLTGAPFRFRPFTIGLVKYDSGTGTVKAPPLTGDWWGFWASCYAYNRGSVRYKWIAASTTTAPLRARQLPDGNQTSPVSTSVVFATSLVSTNWCYDSVQQGSGALHIQAHPCGAYMARLTRQARFDTNEPVDAYTRPHSIIDLDAGSNTYSSSILRAGGEDCQFSYFLGVPPLQVLASS